MIQISSKDDYGLLFLTYLAGAKRSVSVKDAALSLNVSPKYLGRIAVKLQQGGLLISKEGRGGGYRLARPPKQILLKEVFDCLENKIPLLCQRGRACPREKTCSIRSFWTNLGARIAAVLEDISLADIPRVINELP